MSDIDIDLNETYSTPEVEAEPHEDRYLTLDYHPVKPGSVRLTIHDPHRTFNVEDDGEGNLWEVWEPILKRSPLDKPTKKDRGPKFGVVYYETGQVFRLKAVASYTYDLREDE